jgi:hypothetical protein
MAQLKIPGCGVVTTTEKYTICHSQHTGVCFFALVWHEPPADSGSESDDSVNYHRRRHRSSPVQELVPPGPDDDDLPDVGT